MADSGKSRRFTDGIGLGVLTRLIHRDLVDEVLAETGRAGLRCRLLPGRVVVYFVLALALFFADPYEEVLRKLVNGLGFLRAWRPEWTVPTNSALSQARARVGEAPLEELFARVAQPMAGPGTHGAWYAGRRVMAVDGVVFEMPDTEENRAEFGSLGSSETGPAPFPQVRLVGLGECGTHAITDAQFDACHVQERELLERLIAGFEPGMLVLSDRGFFSYELWAQACDTGADLLWRLKSDLRIDPVSVLPDGSYLAVLLPSRVKQSRKDWKKKRVPTKPPGEHAEAITVRVVDYTVPNRAPNRGDEPERFRIMTILLDHEQAPATELAALYHERWEFELTLDEIETHQMEPGRRLRSRTPELVRQEIWAVLLAHYAVRDFMREAADDADVDPDRLSFMRSIRVIRRQVQNQAGFSPHTTSPGDPGGP